MITLNLNDYLLLVCCVIIAAYNTVGRKGGEKIEILGPPVIIHISINVDLLIASAMRLPTTYIVHPFSDISSQCKT